MTQVGYVLSNELQNLEREIADLMKRMQAVEYCQITSGSPLSTASPLTEGGEDRAYWTYVRVYKGYTNKEALHNQMTALQNQMAALQNEMTALQNQMTALQNEKIELLKKENLLLQQQLQEATSSKEQGEEE